MPTQPKSTKRKPKAPTKERRLVVDDRRVFVEEQALAAAALVLADAVEASGLSHHELADRLGVSRPMVTKILGADHASLTLRTLARFADAAGCRLQISMVAAGAPR